MTKKTNNNANWALITGILLLIIAGFGYWHNTIPEIKTYQMTKYRDQIAQNSGQGSHAIPKGSYLYQIPRYDKNNMPIVIQPPQINQLNKLAHQAKKPQLRGFIFIPRANISQMPIYEGNNQNNLALGTATIQALDTVGQGNVAIQGSNYGPAYPDWFLSNLQTNVTNTQTLNNIVTKNNDNIYVVDDQYVSQFKITKQQFVIANSQKETSLLNNALPPAQLKKHHGKLPALLTIKTNYLQNNDNKYQLIITSKLVKQIPKKQTAKIAKLTDLKLDAPIKTAKINGILQKSIAPTIILVVAILLIHLGHSQIKKHKPKPENVTIKIKGQK